MTKFLIIDGNSLGCRAAFAGARAFPDLKSHENIPTATIVCMMNMLNKVFMTMKPTHIVVCWDTDSNTFRKQLYPEYKANRQNVDNHSAIEIDMKVVYKQFSFIRRMLEILGIKNVNKQGYEGDDLCGSFAHISNADKTYIVSGDQDSWALVTPDINIIYPKSGFNDFNIITEDFIYDKYHITVQQYVDLKTLKGDISDNIPGYSGCGPKTASKMLKEFGSADIIASLKEEDLKNYNKTIKNNLKDWQTRYELIKKLMTIRTDVELPYTYDDCEIDLLDWESLKPLLRDLDMNQLLNRMHWGAVYRMKW